jgi:hypothetical protein
MKTLTFGALICLTGMAPLAHTAEMNATDKALLAGISQAQYQALIYTANECGFTPSTALSASLLKSPALQPIVDAMAKPTGPAPVLDAAACAALAKR